MRKFFIIACILHSLSGITQNGATGLFKKDSLMLISRDPAKGFYNDYILFIPKGTPVNKTLVLLVEPNNTGKISDSMEIHTEAAIHLASVSSVGNNVSTELKIPLLVPIFPRPAKQPLVYTHALDRDVIFETRPEMKRLDLQLLQMIEDAKTKLAALHIPVESKVFMNGFSASGSFTNRFSFIHPGKIKALAIGGFNGELMFPQEKIHGATLNYPIGTHDYQQLFSKKFDIIAYAAIPQFIYMGQLDENDAVQFDDAYSKKERRIINNNIGSTVQVRYSECQKVYLDKGINATFNTWEKVGHWTTATVNLAVIKFFAGEMKREKEKQ